MSNPNLLDEKAAAEYIGMSVAFLRAGRIKGILGNQTPSPPWLKLGFSVKYDRRDLDQWLIERRVDPVRRVHNKGRGGGSLKFAKGPRAL